MGSADDTAHAPTEQLAAATVASTSAGGTPAALPIGEVIGDRYEVNGLLGKGGMGAVYRAFDRALGTDVALKVVVADLAGLRDEVRIAQKVTHPNVCRIYDLEDAGGRQFVKMELVEGETLHALLGRAKLSIEQVVTYARAIAAGLAAAHAHGIVHRDLKPGNVMMRGEQPVLMDFGLARTVADGIDERAGTPGYMSPEQLAGTGVDERSDLYALGCLVFEMLAGARLFARGSSLTELATRQRAAPAPDVRSVRADTPRWLARAVRDLLAIDPEARPRGLQQLVRGPRWWPRPLAALVTVAAIAALLWWWWQPPEAPAIRPWNATIAPLGAEYASETAGRMSFSPDGKTIVFPADRRSSDVWRLYTLTLVDQETRAGAPLTGRYPNVRYRRDGRGILITSGIGLVTRDEQGRVDDHRTGTDPDDCGDTIAAIEPGDRPKLVLIDKRDASRRTVVLEAAPEEVLDHPRCDRAGLQIVFARTARSSGHSKIAIVDRAGHVTDVGPGVTPTFTPGGKSIVLSRDGRLVESMLDGRIDRPITTAEDAGAHVAPEVSPDGKLLVFQRESESHALYAGARDDRTQIRRLETPMQLLDAIWPTPDLEHVIALRLSRGLQPSTIIRVPITGDDEQAVLGEGEVVFLSTDGTLVYFTGADDSDLLYVRPVAGGRSRTVAKLPTEILSGADAVDGQHVLTSDGAFRIAGGRAEPEGDHLVIPAPSGPWRAHVAETEVVFTGGDPERRLACIGVLTWFDATHAGCHTNDAVVTSIDLATGALSAFELPWQPYMVVVARDGKHWIATRMVPQTRRMMITNFGERPWAP